MMGDMSSWGGGWGAGSAAIAGKRQVSVLAMTKLVNFSGMTVIM